MINRTPILVQPEPLGRNIDNEIQIASLSADYDESGAITSIAVTATQIDLKDGDNINIAGQSLVVNADAAAGARTLTIDSITLTSPIVTGEQVRINEENLFVQYQRKTEGTIAGMPVDADDLGPINYTGGVYSITGVDPTYMKILPRDFVVNDDGGNEALEFKDGTNTGLIVGSTDQEMIATVNIPYGTTATEVYIWSSNTGRTVEIYEVNINANGIGSAIGTGTTNGSAISIGTIAASSTNYLLILVKVTLTSQRVYGGKVTLTQD